MDILQPAPGASKMGHLLRAIKNTGFVIKWGAHLSTLAAGVWMLHGMVVIKIQANKEQRLLDNHFVKRKGSESYKDDAHLMDTVHTTLYLMVLMALMTSSLLLFSPRGRLTRCTLGVWPTWPA
jgi:hypothetical protein